MRHDIGPLCARVLMAVIFLLSGIHKFAAWDQTVAMISAQGLPAPAAAALLAGLIEVLCGLALVAGYRTKWTAGLLFLYLIPVSLTMHAFWTVTGDARQMQLVNFLKNLAIMGGLVELASYGAGRISLDAGFRSERRPRPLVRETSPVPT